MMIMESLYKIYLQYPIICTDTRNIKKNSLFFCLKGENFDGNQFAEEALHQGAAHVITEDIRFQNKKNFTVVSNTLETLQQLALYHRRKLSIPIIGITGTNGKTTTKELTAAVLKRKFNIAYTQGNLNNHIGVPLTLLSISQDTEIAIVEMGANHLGEIAELCKIVEPDYGIITNIGTAHIEGFLSYKNIIATKKALYQSVINKNGTLFVHQPDEILTQGLNYNKIIYYGGENTPNLKGKVIDMNPTLTLSLVGKTFSTALIGAYNISNMECAAAVGCYFGISEENIATALSTYIPSNNRSQVIISGTNTIIADYYNANPSSMHVALQNFWLLKASQKLVILGEMKELGTLSEIEHKQIIEECVQHQVQAFFIGEEFYKHRSISEFHYFLSLAEAQQYIQENPIDHHLILIKGSRGVHLEKLQI